MKYLNDEQKFIRGELVEKADEINNFVDCDVIYETRTEVMKSLTPKELESSAVALLNALSYRIGTEKRVYKYMLSITKEI